MACLRGVRKFPNGLSGFFGFSALSRRWISSETCVVRGTKEDITFPISMFEPLDDYVAQFPLVTKIPQGRLIMVDPTKQYAVNDHWRPILFTGFLHSHLCKSQGECIANPFDYRNVGVLRDLNMLAFRTFERFQGKTNCDHMDYYAFVQDLFRKFGGSSDLSHQFPEVAAFLDICKKGRDEDKNVMRYNPFFLQDEELANFYSDVRRLLRQELKHRKCGRKAGKILRALNNCYSNTRVVRDCEQHILLEHLLGSHRPKALQQGGLPVPTTQAVPQVGGLPVPTTQAVPQVGGLPVPTTQTVPQVGGLLVPTTQAVPQGGYPGTALVDVCRIAVQHAIEDNLLKNALSMYPQEKELLKSYSRVEFIRALRYMFERYPSEALFLFNQHEVFEHLKMERRLPTPGMLKYIPPDRGQ